MKKSDAAIAALIVAGGLLSMAIASLFLRGVIDRLSQSSATKDEAERSLQARSQEIAAVQELSHLPERRARQTLLSPTEKMLIFPTRHGLESWTAALATGDALAAGASAEASDALVIAIGTHCSVVDADGINAKVRLDDGPHAGFVGYVPSHWVR